MKVSIFTGRYGTNPEKRWSHIEAAARIAEKQKSKLLILPGWSLHTRKPDVTQKVISLAKKRNLRIFFDAREFELEGEYAKAYLARPFKTNKVASLKGPFEQLFCTSKEAPPYACQLAELLNTGERSFKISSIQFSAMLCGENNIIINKQSRCNIAVDRQGAKIDINCYHVMINQCHSTMGNWGKLNARFRKLSEKRRYVVYLTNNTNSGDSWKSALKVFYNGKELLDGNFKNEDVGLFHIRNDWRLATIEIDKIEK